jgi:hypothetical protein
MYAVVPVTLQPHLFLLPATSIAWLYELIL